MNILHVADKEMIGIYTRSFDWQVKIQVFFSLCSRKTKLDSIALTSMSDSEKKVWGENIPIN